MNFSRLGREKKKKVAFFSSLFRSDQAKFFYRLVGFILLYGIAINLITFGLGLMSINLAGIISLGLIFYFIKEELPELVRRCRR